MRLRIMRFLRIVLLIFVLALVGLGFYRGWFSFSADSADEKTNITLTIDQQQIREDVEQAREAIQGAETRVREGISTPEK